MGKQALSLRQINAEFVPLHVNELDRNLSTLAKQRASTLVDALFGFYEVGALAAVCSSFALGLCAEPSS